MTRRIKFDGGIPCNVTYSNLQSHQKDFSRQIIDDVDISDLDKDKDYVRLVQLSQANWLRYENRYNTAMKS